MELLKNRFIEVRLHTEKLCETLITEDYSVQPVDFVSPPKWHLAHVTWFWEEFVLKVYNPKYKPYHEDFAFLFNSYYNNVGKRVLRPTRGLMTRPSVSEIYEYRKYVTNEMITLFSTNLNKEAFDVIEIGINHEQQHQELLIYDIKYILGHQPLFPKYLDKNISTEINGENAWIEIPEGIYNIGHNNSSFCFDNELGNHKVFLQKFQISNLPITNGEYLEFIEAGGYSDFNLWHDEGWHWVNNNSIKAPLYWHTFDNDWYEYDVDGLHLLNKNKPVKHVSFFEAFAFSQWKKMRLPTEFEWEVASKQILSGHNWEWTQSAYLPYPNYKKADGALGEYNGKFMVNQMVLRGASNATPDNHSRVTYRNFFQANMRWQYSGIRLVK